MSSMVRSDIRGVLRETFGFDLRSLALLRVALAVMLLVDLAVRAVTLTEHYTDTGVLPRALLRETYLDHHPGRYSFHMWGGDLSFQVWLFVAAALCALPLLVGTFSRIALLASWVLLCSVQNRNFMIETGGDYLLRLACLWALFFPLASVWSWDAARRRGKFVAGSPRKHHATFATFAFLAQLSCVSWFSAIHKTHRQWRVDFTAVHYALHIDAYATPFGVWLRQFPDVTRVLTIVVLWFEYVMPFFVCGFGLLSIVPGLGAMARIQSPIRTVAVFAFVVLHSGLGLGLSLGTFPWFAAVIWLGVLPGWFWDRLLAPGLRRLRLPRLADAVVGALESESGQAAMGSGGAEPSPSSTFAAFRARAQPLLRATPAVLAAVLLYYTVAINLGTVSRRFRPLTRGSGLTLVPDASRAIDFLRLDQHWGLFAPYPRVVDGWYVLLGTQLSGTQVDPRAPDTRLTWKRPRYVSSSYPTFRVRKYFRNIRRKYKRFRRQRSAYTTYLCRHWNARHSGDDRIETLDLIFMGRKTRKRGGHKAPKRKTLWHRTCPDIACDGDCFQWGENRERLDR